jgi:hypothetical protein
LLYRYSSTFPVSRVWLDGRADSNQNKYLEVGVLEFSCRMEQPAVGGQRNLMIVRG